MITYAFDFGLWTILFFILGMYSPKLPLFFLKKPDRFLILVITTVFVMITFTLYGEGTRQEKLALEAAKKTATAPQTTDVKPIPVPVPTPIPTPATANPDKAK